MFAIDDSAPASRSPKSPSRMRTCAPLAKLETIPEARLRLHLLRHPASIPSRRQASGTFSDMDKLRSVHVGDVQADGCSQHLHALLEQPRLTRRTRTTEPRRCPVHEGPNAPGDIPAGENQARAPLPRATFIDEVLCAEPP